MEIMARDDLVAIIMTRKQMGILHAISGDARPCEDNDTPKTRFFADVWDAAEEAEAKEVLKHEDWAEGFRVIMEKE